MITASFNVPHSDLSFSCRIAAFQSQSVAGTRRRLLRFILLHPRLLLDGAPLIAIHKGRYYRRGDGLALGPGPFVTGLEYAADCRATVVGKPERSFFTQVRGQRAGLHAGRLHVS